MYESPAPELERYRGYVRILAQCQLGGRFRAKLDASDVAQEVLLKAWRDRERFQGLQDDEIGAFLRTILAHTLANVARDLHREKRDVRLERSLDASLDQSSAALLHWLSASGPSPSEEIRRLEDLEKVADALERLPEAQRRAFVLRHWVGYSLDEISEELGRSAGAAALLVHRALKRLREELADGSA